MASFQSYPLLQNVKLTPASGALPGAATGTAAYTPAAQPSFLTPQQIQAQVAKYVGQLPASLTPAQIRQQAQAEIAPQISALSKALQSQVAGASRAITGYTGSLADALAGTDFSAPYTQAEGQQAAVDSALAQALSGAGTQGAADLQARLAALNEPNAVNPAAAAVAATGQGNSNTVLGAGSSNLSALIADRAAASSYGQKLPGIARLAGAQDIANVQGNAQQTLGTQTQAIESELPNILSGLRSSSDTNATNRANLGERLTEYLNSANASEQASAAKQQQTAYQLYLEGQKLGLVAKNQSFNDWYKTQSLGVARTRANAPKVIGSGTSGYYSFDPATGQVTRIVSPVTKPGAGSAATGGLTSSSWASLVKAATSSVADGLKTKAPGEHYVTPTAANGLKQGEFIPVPGTGTQATPYHEALQTVLAMGPATAAWQKKAIEIVNAQYPMGSNGRPYEGTAARQFVATQVKNAASRGYDAAEAFQRIKASGLVDLPDAQLQKMVQAAYAPIVAKQKGGLGLTAEAVR